MLACGTSVMNANLTLDLNKIKVFVTFACGTSVLNANLTLDLNKIKVFVTFRQEVSAMIISGQIPHSVDFRY